MSTASSASPGSAVSSYRDIVAPPSSTTFDARHGGTGVSDNDLTNAIQTVPHHPHHPDQDPTNPKNLIGNNRVTPTWDGSKTTLSAFIYDLKSYFRRDNTMWHFIVSYFIPDRLMSGYHQGKGWSPPNNNKREASKQEMKPSGKRGGAMLS